MLGGADREELSRARVYARGRLVEARVARLRTRVNGETTVQNKRTVENLDQSETAQFSRIPTGAQENQGVLGGLVPRCLINERVAGVTFRAAARPILVNKQHAPKPRISRNHILKPLVWIACSLPLASLVYGAFEATLGANPIERITHRTGLTALVLLMLGLAITPLRRWTGLLWLIQYRRLVGLFAFFYGCLHLLTYVWLDQMFSPGAIVHDVAKRPFITMGMTAFVLLVPLALTSTQRSIRWLGKNWGRLHRLVYVAATAGAIHFYWLVKRDKHEPLQYVFLLLFLLGWRAAVWAGKAQPWRKFAFTAE